MFWIRTAPRPGVISPAEELTPARSRIATPAGTARTDDWPEREHSAARPLAWPVVFAFFFALAIVQTWPLALHITDHTIGWQGDSYVMWWNLEWVKHSLLHFSNPFHTGALFAPQGSNLYLHTLNLVNAVLALPFLLATDNILLAWNIELLAFIALAGTGGYALCFHVTRDRWASLFGGFVFAFAPHVMMQLAASHQNIAATWPIPFFALYLLRFFESHRKRDLMIAAVLGAVMTWNWLEFAVDAALLSVVIFAFWAAIKARRGEAKTIAPMVRSLLPGLALWLVLSAPVLALTAFALQSGDYSVNTDTGGADYYAPDVAAYLTPSPLWGGNEPGFDYLAGESSRVGTPETTEYLGFAPLVLAGVAIALRRRTGLQTSIKFWSVVFGFFFVLSLGPQLHYLGYDLFPMPFKILQAIPLAGARRAPGRMIIVGMLALGVLATIGISALAARYTPRIRHVRLILISVALLVLFFEYWNSPVGLASYNVPAIYHQIAAEDGQYAVMDLPLGRATGNRVVGDSLGAALADYAQVVHGKDDIGGYLSRVEERNLTWLPEQPGLGYLACLHCNGYPRAIDNDVPRVRALFAELHIKYIVLNFVTFEGDPTTLTSSPTSTGTAYQTQTYLDSLGLERVSSGDGWLAYRNPDVE